MTFSLQIDILDFVGAWGIRGSQYHKYNLQHILSKFSVLKLIELLLCGFITPSHLASTYLGILVHNFSTF